MTGDRGVGYSGSLRYPVADARAVHRFFRDWTADLDPAMCAAVTLVTGEDAAVLVRGTYHGPEAAPGRALVDRWRDWRTPDADHWAPGPPPSRCDILLDATDVPGTEGGAWTDTAAGPAAGAALPPARPALVTTATFRTLHENALDVVLATTYLEPGRTPRVALADLRHTRDGVRGGPGFVLHLVAVPAYAAANPAVEAHLRAAALALRPYVADFVPVDDDAESRPAEPPRPCLAVPEPEVRLGFSFA